jgi:glutamate:GABA antiporter
LHDGAAISLRQARGIMPENEVSNRPRRVMGFRDLLLFYIVTGISLRWIATAATAGASAVVIWLIAWCAFYLPLALSVIELTSRYPQEGGLYVWSKKAFGDFGGFISGWMYWTSNIPFFPSLLYFAASNALFIGPARWSYLQNNKWYFILFAVFGILLGTVTNVLGLSVGKWLHNAGAIGTFLPIAILYFIGIACWWKFGSATSFAPSQLVPHAHFQDVLFWATIVFALGGSESASFLGDEIKNPRRNMPRALIIAGVVVTSGYILGSVAMLVALPASELSGLEGLMQAVSHAAHKIGLGGLTPITALLITVSNLGALGAWFAAVGRLPFVAGIDRYLPPAFGKLHPRWQSPYVALLVQAACAIVFIFLGQAGASVYSAYEVLVSIGIISYFIPYLYLFASLIKLQREPAGPEIIRVPGGKPVAYFIGTLGFITSVVTIILSLVPPTEEPHKIMAVLKIVIATAVMVGIGVGLFYVGRNRVQRTANSAS